MDRNEFLYGTIIRAFNIIRKITGGQLILFAMISDALAADPFTRAGFVGAIAKLLVLFDPAFHGGSRVIQNAVKDRSVLFLS